MNARLIAALICSIVLALTNQTAEAQNSKPIESQKIQPQQKSNNGVDNAWLETQLTEIERKRKQVEKYDPMVKGYLVSYSAQDYILLAVSPKARETWLTSENALNTRQNSNNKLDAALDALAVAAAEKLPIYRIDVGTYAVRNAPEEEIIKAALPNLGSLEIHKIGLKQMNWLISRDESGEPKSRFKNGVILARDAADDHSYCWLYYIHIVQDYSDGAYGGAYGKATTKQLIGCPKNAQAVFDNERHD